MTSDQTLISFFFDAGPIVKAVMFLLLVVSVISWTFIFQRGWVVKTVEKAVKRFEEQFWSGTDLTLLYNDLRNDPSSKGIQSIFQAGFKEYARLQQQDGILPEAVIEGAQRAMRIAHAREVERLEQHLSFLATVGSTSPYIGLFGTVWGIMTSFRALGVSQQATIAMVAPGISEALIATAMGLFAAIPAVIAYNRYANKAERLLNNYDTFQEEFSSILYRQIHGSHVA